MKEKLLRALKWAAYPAFYFACLVLFGYLTFPFDRLKDRILGEISKQIKGKNPPVVTIDKLDSYWLSGVELEGVKVRLPAKDDAGFGSGRAQGFGAGSFALPSAKSEPEKDSVIEVKEAHARARLLPLLIGRVQLDFWASVFGGEVEGTAPAGTSKGDVELNIEGAKLSEVEPLQNLLGVPIDGLVNGALSLSPTDGKFNKAAGKVELSIKNIVVSDGKTKIGGLLAIPPAKVDEIVLTGEAEKGVLKITKLSAGGPDLELEGDGKINLREPWGDSSVDVYVKFRFTDAYRGKDATTKSILGEPGSSGTPIIEMQVSKFKKAKRADGYYGFHIHGKLKNLEFTPSSTDASGSSGTSRTKKSGGSDASPPGGVAGAGGGKRPGGIALPLGMSTALSNREKEPEEEKKEEPKKEEPREDAKEENKEEGKEDRPSGGNPAGRLPFLRPAVTSRSEPAQNPEPEPPVIAAPPDENPGGGGEEKPEEKPNEEPR